MAKKLNKGKPKFPGKLETNVNTNPIVNNQMPDTVGKVMVNGKPYVKPPTSKDAIREDKKTTLSKVGDFLENPLPSSTGNNSDNMFNMVAGLPGQALKAVYNTAKNASKPVDTAKKLGNAAYGIAGELVGDAQTTPIEPGLKVAMDAAFAIPTVMGAKKAIKAVKSIANNKTSVNELINQTASKANSEARRLAVKNNQIAKSPSELRITDNSNLNTIDFRKNPISDKVKRMYELMDKDMKFSFLPKTINKKSIETLENFKTRIQTPEGKIRLKELGIEDDRPLRELEIVEDANEYGYYSPSRNKIAIHPEHPLPKKVIRHEIEHGVQGAISDTKMNKLNNELGNFKYLFRPKKAAAAKYEALNPTSKIDDLLSGLELRKEGTPNKIWNRDRKNNPIDISDYKQNMLNNQRATDYFLTGSGGKEKSAFLGEVQQYMMDQGTIPKTSYTNITPEMVKETHVNALFDEAGGGKYLRLFNIMKPSANNYDVLSKGLNKMLGVAPIALGAGALGAGAASQQKRNGGVIEYAGGGTINTSREDMYTIAKHEEGGTILNEGQKIAYNNWLKNNNITESEDYDMKGYWKEKGFLEPKHVGHFDDTYKVADWKPFTKGNGDNYPAISEGSKYSGNPNYINSYSNNPSSNSSFDKRGQGFWDDKDNFVTYAGGGRIPIVVNDPNDPRLRAYNDSNTLYGVTSLAKKFLATKPTMEQWIDYANNENVDVTKAWNKLKKVNNKYPEPIKKEPVFLNSTTTGKKEEGALNYYKKPVQPYVYEKAKPVVKQNIPQSIANQTSDFQPDMVQTNNTPNYDKTKLYQGYDFIQQTGLRPGDYTESQVQEAMKNKGLPKKSLGGRVLPKFGKGSTYRGGGDSLPVPPGAPPSSVQGNIGTGAGIAAAAVPMLTSFIPDDKVTDSEGNEIGSETSLGKGALEGAAKGAQVTAMLGGADFGASIAVGAGIGAIQANMGNEDLKRERNQANMRIQNRSISNSVLTNKNMFSTNTSNNDQMIAANGGTVIDEDMGNPNAELELNETFRDPMTGETGMVDGPSHDNGGIEMSLAEGTQIWSDRLKHNGRTFASLTKPIINKIANIEKGLDTNPNSRFKQNSIKLLNAQLDFFFDIQESNKQQDEMKRTLKKQEGGVVDDMGNYHYANGGIYIKPENRNMMAMGGMMKHSMGGNVLPKHWDGNSVRNPNSPYRFALRNPNMLEFDPAMSNYKANQNADLAEVNNTLGNQMNKMNAANRTVSNVDPNAALKRSIKPYYNNADNNYEAAPPIEDETEEVWKGTVPTDMNALRKAQGEYENQRSLDAKSQNANTSQGYIRNNNGELIQAGALTASTIAQLNNINKQAAPANSPDVRLTSAISNPNLVDLSAERGAINRSALGAMEGAQRGLGNSASALAFKNKARINQLQGLGQSFSNQEIANADIGNKFAGMRGDAAMKEAIMNSQINTQNNENRYAFNQNRMANQNAAIGTLGHGFGDIGRNRTNQFNEMERLGSISNRYDKSAYASSIRDNPARLKQGIDAGMYTIDELQKWGIPYTPHAKYGGTFKKGTIKTRSLKY